MQSSQNIIRSEVTEATFNLMSDAEKQGSLSVIKIQTQSALDANGRAIPGLVSCWYCALCPFSCADSSVYFCNLSQRLI